MILNKLTGYADFGKNMINGSLNKNPFDSITEYSEWIRNLGYVYLSDLLLERFDYNIDNKEYVFELYGNLCGSDLGQDVWKYVDSSLHKASFSGHLVDGVQGYSIVTDEQEAYLLYSSQLHILGKLEATDNGPVIVELVLYDSKRRVYHNISKSKLQYLVEKNVREKLRQKKEAAELAQKLKWKNEKIEARKEYFQDVVEFLLESLASVFDFVVEIISFLFKGLKYIMLLGAAVAIIIWISMMVVNRDKEISAEPETQIKAEEEHLSSIDRITIYDYDLDIYIQKNYPIMAYKAFQEAEKLVDFRDKRELSTEEIQKYGNKYIHQVNVTDERTILFSREILAVSDELEYLYVDEQTLTITGGSGIVVLADFNESASDIEMNSDVDQTKNNNDSETNFDDDNLS